MTDLAKALTDRLESDAFLGAREIRVTIPARVATSQACAASAVAANPPAQPRLTGPAVRRVPLDDAEINRRQTALDVIDNDEVKGCTQCVLHETRTKTAFGVGAPNARIMFVGEGPGYNEDQQGEPFVGEAGKLLTKMIEAGMGLSRSDVYICNIVKCRPPNNRNPAAEEVVACKGYLKRQIEIVRPEVIVALGAPAAQTLLNTTQAIGRLRGTWHDFDATALTGKPIPLIATYHPAYLLRSPDEKKKSWADLQMVMERLGLPLPAR